MLQQLPLTSLLAICVFTLSAILFVKNLWKYRNLPPGPWGLPIVGFSIFLDPKAPYKTLTELSLKYGKIFCLQLGCVRVVVLADYKLIKKAFAKEPFAGRPPLPVTHGIMKGYGILGAEGPWWSEQRRFLSDSLRTLGVQRHSSKGVLGLEAKIMSQVNVCLENFDSHKDGEPFDCHSLLSHVFGNIISQLIFGQAFPVGDKDFERQLYLVDQGFKQVDIMGVINFFPFLRFLPYFRPAFKKLLDDQVTHHFFIKKQIDYHKNTLEEDNPRDYLDLFLIEMKERRNKKGSTFVDAQLIHTLADLFGAGLETSKVTFHWLLIYLMTNQDIQEKLQKELDDVIGKNRIPTIADLGSLPYLEAVVMETQRIANLVPLGAPHGSTKDCELEGYTIPAGTMVMGLLWSVHMNPDLWEDPEKFNPDRFLQDGALKKLECFIPFSAGRRMCPGDELARFELLLMIGCLMQKFTVLPPDGETIDKTPQMGVTLTPLPYKLRIVSRK